LLLWEYRLLLCCSQLDAIRQVLSLGFRLIHRLLQCVI